MMQNALIGSLTSQPKPERGQAMLPIDEEAAAEFGVGARRGAEADTGSSVQPVSRHVESCSGHAFADEGRSVHATAHLPPAAPAERRGPGPPRPAAASSGTYRPRPSESTHLPPAAALPPPSDQHMPPRGSKTRSNSFTYQM
jgi:hypothetical protein